MFFDGSDYLENYNGVGNVLVNNHEWNPMVLIENNIIIKPYYGKKELIYD